MKKFVLFILLLLVALPFTVSAQDEVVELTMGSWRTEDIEQWGNILEVFHAAHPNIRITFEPTLNTEYDAQITNALEGGVGPDLITCRPFDRALLNYQLGGMADISDLPGLENFSEVALSAWQTDDGSATFCVPMASVIHGYIYNKTLFDELGLEEPTTESEFFAVLDALAEAGETPLGITTKDAWATAAMGFNNQWPNFCDGENTRQALLAGDAALTDPCFVDTFESLARWESYLPEGHEALGYADAQQAFPLGLTAIYPSGSWEIPLFNDLADFELAAFKPYVPDDKEGECWISDHVDIAIGMNANTPHPEEARTFLEWLTTQEFAQVFSDNQPGFFSLSNHEVTLSDPLAAEFVSWRQECGSTIRIFDQFLSRGEPGGNTLMTDNIYLLVQGQLTPEEVANTIQTGLEEWFFTDDAGDAATEEATEEAGS
jgi:raffinose/stachyose/melibiose transport system substrate-binding protein